jgi:predicted TIM-barrel fold metal-dependent hydrolase
VTTITDAHHHIWWLDRTPWLSGPPAPRIFGDYEPLRRDYTIEEFAADARAHGVIRSVHVQVNVAPGDEVAEVAWATQGGAREGLVQAVVAFADLAASDVGEVLDRQLDAGPVRGIRQQLHWHENPAYRFAPAPDVMRGTAWRRGLREVTRRGLLFELQVFPGQYGHALDLVDHFPETTFVLLHAGMPEDDSDAGRAAWRAGLAQLAKRPHVYVKLSGLGTFARRYELAGVRPIVEQAVELFGAERCLFGSNFPIEKLWTDYGALLDVFTRSLDACSGCERELILNGTAARLYRL